ncbi:MAG: glycosyltransferase family 4 protein [Deltaproteobacteria bacterium]|nr:glycosyltransferase family 4 protein [Deltaproteobacteria bacterium]
MQNTENVNLLLAGSHQSLYRVRSAVEALRIVLEQAPGTRLIIAGRCTWDREEQKAVHQLQKFITELQLDSQIKVTGPYSQTGAPALFQQAHILMHTKYNDPCPRLVVEGMACGLPVVYSATGGVPELVGKEAGRGVAGPLDWERDHPPEPAALAEQLLLVMSDLTGYSRAARNRAVTHFDVQPWLTRHGEIFKHVLDDTSAANR